MGKKVDRPFGCRNFYNFYSVPNNYTGIAYLEYHCKYVWYKDGMFHRLDGPAEVVSNRHHDFLYGNFYIHGEGMSERVYEEHKLVKAYTVWKTMDEIMNPDNYFDL